MECKLSWHNKETKETICSECGRIKVTSQDDLAKVHFDCSLTREEFELKEIPPIVQRLAPPMITRVKNFTVSAIAHATAGSPTCTQEEINERFEICRGCELFIKSSEEAGICGHQSCGCNLNKEMIYLNKLGWADQECPLRKWLKINKQPPETT